MGQQTLEAGPSVGWGGRHHHHLCPQSGAHASPSSLPGQSYEVQMLCNSKLGDATQWPRLLKVGASPPSTGRRLGTTVPLGRKPMSSL